MTTFLNILNVIDCIILLIFAKVGYDSHVDAIPPQDTTALYLIEKKKARIKAVMLMSLAFVYPILALPAYSFGIIPDSPFITAANWFSFGTLSMLIYEILPHFYVNNSKGCAAFMLSVFAYPAIMLAYYTSFQ